MGALKAPMLAMTIDEFCIIVATRMSAGTKITDEAEFTKKLRIYMRGTVWEDYAKASCWREKDYIDAIWLAHKKIIETVEAWPYGK